jgi:hypothetical protein
MTLLLLMLTGCAEYELAMEDSAEMAGGDFVEEYVLRLDVWPAAGEGMPSLPQSFFDVAFDSNSAYTAALALRSPVTVTGQLTGFDANPTAIGVPGKDSIVTGFVDLSVPGTPMERVVATDSQGFFEAEVVPADGYTLALIPELPAELPFLVLENESVFGPIDLSTYLDYGLPVYGKVAVGEDDYLDSGVARLVHKSSGVTGPTVSLDRGHYMLRAYPGEYTLQIYDPEDLYVPLLEQDLLVGGESLEGVEASFTLPGLPPVLVTGEIRDPDGRPYEDVELRFTSTELLDLPQGSHSSSVATNQSGLFIARLPPGEYRVEYVPPFGDEVSSEQVIGLSLSENSELGVTQLEPLSVVQAQVVFQGEQVGATLVRAEELGAGGRVFQTTAADDGYFSLPVSTGPLLWTFTPPYGVEAATTFKDWDAVEFQERSSVSLDAGILLEGEVTFEGEPVPYSVVDVRDQDDTLWAQTVTDEAGAFSVRVSTQVEPSEE